MYIGAPFRCKNKDMEKVSCEIHSSCPKSESRSSLDTVRKCAVGTQIASYCGRMKCLPKHRREI